MNVTVQNAKSSKQGTVKAAAAARRASSRILQRACACGQHTLAGGECASCRDQRALSLQRIGRGGSNLGSAPPIVHEVLRSTGQPLDRETREFMEPRFGHDFSRVRVHTGARAAESARVVDARAYTVGQDIVFGAGRYAPHEPETRHLLAHELTHTLQQSADDARHLNRQGESNSDAGPAEDEAKQTADMIVAKGAKKKTKARPKQKKPSKPKPPPNPCTHNILFENTCSGLVESAAGRCCDPANGIKHSGGRTDLETTEEGQERKPCPSAKYTPLFTFDGHCPDAVAKGCSDTDRWMALPRKQFDKSKCGDFWTICANGKSTTGYVRERSNTQTQFEVGLGIKTALGLPGQGSFKGALYRPGAAQAKIDADPCCKAPIPAPAPASDTDGDSETALAQADIDTDTNTGDTTDDDRESA